MSPEVLVRLVVSKRWTARHAASTHADGSTHQTWATHVVATSRHLTQARHAWNWLGGWAVQSAWTLLGLRSARAGPPTGGAMEMEACGAMEASVKR